MSYSENRSALLADHVVPLASAAVDLMDAMDEFRLNARSYGMSGDTEYFDAAKAAQSQVTTSFQALKDIVRGHHILSPIQPLEDQFQTAFNNYNAAFDHVHNLIQREKTLHSEMRDAAEVARKNYLELLDGMIAASRKDQEAGNYEETTRRFARMEQIIAAFNQTEQFIQAVAWSRGGQGTHQISTLIQELQTLPPKLAEVRARQVNPANQQRLDHVMASLETLIKNGNDVLQLQRDRNASNQRSAQAAKETAERIEDSIRKSAAGVELSAKVSESLVQIVQKARQVDELVAEIATASREQSQGIDQVNTAVTQMDKVTQTNAAAAEESASASEELNAQAATLRDLVAELELLVTGHAATRTHTSTAPITTRQSAGGGQASGKFGPKPGSRSLSLAVSPHQPQLGSGTRTPKKSAEDQIPLDAHFKDQ